jgi:hypothetical protein
MCGATAGKGQIHVIAYQICKKTPREKSHGRSGYTQNDNIKTDLNEIDMKAWT